MKHLVFALAYWSHMKYLPMGEVWQIHIYMGSPKDFKYPCPTIVVSSFSHCKYSSLDNFGFGCVIISFSVLVPFSTSWLHPKNICKFDI